jgi:signal transduction histidine kinase
MMGTGLGLWVGKSLVDRHEGHLKIRSTQGDGCQGTIVQLFLPFDQTKASAIFS